MKSLSSREHKSRSSTILSRSFSAFKNTRSYDQPAADETSKAIAGQLGGIPLAIVQMAAIIRRQNLSLKEFFDLYKEGANLHALHQFRIGAQRGYEHSLASVWTLDELSPGALVLLDVLSFLDLDAIQEEIILAGLQQEITAQNQGSDSNFECISMALR